jgi:hypothetical protein
VRAGVARAPSLVALAAVTVAAWVTSAACIASPDARTTPTSPDRASFPPVSEYLVHTCGSIDCHGDVHRNLRLYGIEGRRLDPNDRPEGVPTTVAEFDANYTGIVLLEPEAMTRVENDKGAAPERLSLIRKARGMDNHKGGTLVTEGADGDRCVTSWLAGAVDVAACTRATAQ